MEYLGYIILSGTVKLYTKKTEAISKWASLTKPRELQVFLGFYNYYGHFICHFANLAEPLYNLP